MNRKCKKNFFFGSFHQDNRKFISYLPANIVTTSVSVMFSSVMVDSVIDKSVFDDSTFVVSVIALFVSDDNSALEVVSVVVLNVFRSNPVQ